MNLSDSFKERLKEVMAGESNISFAEKCGLSEGTFRRYLRGDTFPPLDTLEKIADASGYSLAWLASGKGEMKRGETGGEAGVRACVSPAQGADLAPDMLELARLLDRYGNKALVENVRQRLLKIKQETEG
jgi:transcriptional regulator with XRE-family HTH domain